MTRKIGRSLAHHGGDREEAEAMLDVLIPKLTAGGWLDDGRFVTARVQELHRKGLSARGIRAKLAQQGGPEQMVRAALEDLASDGGDTELTAALNLARRKRIGPFQEDPERRLERKQKDFAAMARAGFSYGVARRVLDAEDPAELEEQAAAGL
jgi:regulatory protein